MLRRLPLENVDLDCETFVPDTSASHIEQGCRLRILIVGAGVAGTTLAALLRQRGEHPVLIERASKEEAGGYMLGLLPLGGRVLNGLKLSQAYEKESVSVSIYDLYGRKGQRLHRYPLTPLVERFGSWRGIERGALLALLRKQAGEVRFETTVTGIAETDHGAKATFSDGSTGQFDLIVGADGIQSSIRDLILGAKEVDHFDTGWGGFVLWSRPELGASDTYSELWSAGWGIGLYPVPNRIGIFLAGRHKDLIKTDAESYAARIEGRLRPSPFLDALKARERKQTGFYWKMEDYRAKTWSRGRTVLLGDAAAAFLPTAGVGASAAMDSAAALADEISRADSRHMDYALDLYEKRQRDRVEKSQKNSRDLAQFMFVNTSPTAWARDKLVAFYSLKRLVTDISKVMAGE